MLNEYKGYYIGMANGKPVYLNLDRPRSGNELPTGIFFGELGRGSKIRRFHKDNFVLNLVPEYALLKKEGERIRVWDSYGKASEQETKIMLLQGWKRRTDADISEYITTE